jgi:hypothetical protein
MWKRAGVVLTVALVTALLVVPLAMGQGGSGKNNGKPQAKGKSKFELNGTVTTAASGGIIVVKVKSGTKTVKAYLRTDLELTIDEKAKLVDGTGDESVPTTIDAFVEGSKVHVGGVINRDDPKNPEFIAKRLILQKLPVAP